MRRGRSKKEAVFVQKFIIFLEIFAKMTMFGLFAAKFWQNTRNFAFLAKMNKIFSFQPLLHLFWALIVNKCCYSIGNIAPTPVSTSSGLCTKWYGTGHSVAVVNQVWREGVRWPRLILSISLEFVNCHFEAIRFGES
jgi:hypothetical protein